MKTSKAIEFQKYTVKPTNRNRIEDATLPAAPQTISAGALRCLRRRMKANPVGRIASGLRATTFSAAAREC
jgi:hypothetical protein